MEKEKKRRIKSHTKSKQKECTDPWCDDDFSQVQVHPVVAGSKVAVVRFTVFKLHQLLKS